MHRMELVRDVGHVQSRCGPFGCKLCSWFAPKQPLAQKSFWTNPTVHLGDEAQLEACFGPFEDSANLDAR
jgi:hypothetical protein